MGGPEIRRTLDLLSTAKNPRRSEQSLVSHLKSRLGDDRMKEVQPIQCRGSSLRLGRFAVSGPKLPMA